MTNESQSQLPVPVNQPKAVRLWPLWLVIIILIVSLAGLASYGWVNLQQIEKLELQISYIAKDDGSQSRNLEQLESQIGQQATDFIAQNRALNSQLATHRRQIEHNARQLSEVGGKGRTDWLLAETEYLMRLANQRLNMEKDAVGAEAILQAADGVLAESDDPGLYLIRQQLSKDILALQRVSGIDREGIYLQLEALIDLLDKLDQSHYQTVHNESFSPTPALNDAGNAAIEESGFNHFLTQALNELKKLVVIRRLDEAVEPLLAPDQVYYLKQNLRLMLEQAELALLDRNQPMYIRSLTKAEEWIKTYFSQNKEDTTLILSTLGNLKSHQINPELPDVSQSLQLLKKRITLLYRQHQLSPSPAAGSKSMSPTNNAPTTANNDASAHSPQPSADSAESNTDKAQHSSAVDGAAE